VVNPKLAEKFVKIPKGEKEGWQTVILEFAVGEDGVVSDVRVANPNEVDAALAVEALRVMRLSPRWAPATFYGERVRWTCQQGIEFDVTR
jgi:outer membrane biosynthesis protein TonB